MPPKKGYRVLTKFEYFFETYMTKHTFRKTHHDIIRTSFGSREVDRQIPGGEMSLPK